MTDQPNHERVFRSRKWMLACATLAVITVALFMDKLSGEWFANCLWPIMVMYGAGSVGDKFAKRSAV